MPRKKLIIISLTFSALFLITLTITYAVSSVAKGSIPLPGGLHSQLSSANNTSLDQSVKENFSEDQDTLNILVVGNGGPGHPGGSLSDIIVIAHLNPNTNTLALISLPRDLYVNNSLITGKLNSAYAKGGNVAKELISEITGLHISYFLGADFVGFQRAIGQIGGIEVEVIETLDDEWYPKFGYQQDLCGLTPEETTELTNTLSGFELEKQFPCRYEHLHFDPGTIYMEGGEALKFVRSRHSTSDFSRTKRAQAVISGIIKNLLSLDALENIPRFFEEIVVQISTDLDSNALNHLIPTLKTIPNLTIKSISLTPENVLTSSGNLIPKNGVNSWSGIRAYIKNELQKP